MPRGCSQLNLVELRLGSPDGPTPPVMLTGQGARRASCQVTVMCGIPSRKSTSSTRSPVTSASRDPVPSWGTLNERAWDRFNEATRIRVLRVADDALRRPLLDDLA